MTELLVKLFIKDHNLVEDRKVRESYGILSSIVGFFCNVLLFIVKLSIGFVIGSISVMADAFNNLSDAASAIISFIGVKLANRPADKEHPFGHGRFEYISALIVAFLVIQVGFTCFKNAITKILHPQELQFNPWLLGILCLSVFVKIWLVLFYDKLGKRINSNVMKATATDALGDIFITSATIVSITISELLHVNIDGYMGFVVSIFVIIAGFNIVKSTLEPLLGEAVSPEIYDSITKAVEGYEGIIGSHDLIVHNYGPSHIMATIHAEVPNDMDFETAHETIDRIERDVLRDLSIFLVIHMDPIEMKDEKVLEYRELVQDIVKTMEEEASIHDFRVVSGEKEINLIFDVVVPYSYDDAASENLKDIICRKVKGVDSRINCVIIVENSFLAEQ